MHTFVYISTLFDCNFDQRSIRLRKFCCNLGLPNYFNISLPAVLAAKMTRAHTFLYFYIPQCYSTILKIYRMFINDFKSTTLIKNVKYFISVVLCCEPNLKPIKLKVINLFCYQALAKEWFTARRPTAENQWWGGGAAKL